MVWNVWDYYLWGFPTTWLPCHCEMSLLIIQNIQFLLLVDHESDPAITFEVITRTPPTMSEHIVNPTLDLNSQLSSYHLLSCVTLGKLLNFSEPQALPVKLIFVIPYFDRKTWDCSCLFLFLYPASLTPSPSSPWKDFVCLSRSLPGETTGPITCHHSGRVII